MRLGKKILAVALAVGWVTIIGAAQQDQQQSEQPEQTVPATEAEQPQQSQPDQSQPQQPGGEQSPQAPAEKQAVPAPPPGQQTSSAPASEEKKIEALPQAKPSAQIKPKRAKKTSRKKHKKTHQRSAEQKIASDGTPHRIIVRRGSTSETGGLLAPGMNAQEAQHQQQSTSQLLQTADANLKNVAGRNLTRDQQDMVRQINNYMEQSRVATQEGDYVRARNLALKARLLSDELVRR